MIRRPENRAARASRHALISYQADLSRSGLMLSRRTKLCCAACFLSTAPCLAQAQGDALRKDASGTSQRPASTQKAPSQARTSSRAYQSSEEESITVSAKLDHARARIFPSLGAVSYKIDQRQINVTPGGQNASISQYLLRVPGVVQDGNGQIHVRGDHNNLTYRVNGILLPESLNGYAQDLDSRIIQSVSLLTGTLPAQFGFRTAGVIDVTTKTGASLKENQLGIYGGSYNTINPSLQMGGSKGKWDWFFVTSYNQDNIGIDNPTASFRPTHDRTRQGKGFTYLSYRVDDQNRISLLGSASYQHFQLPNTTALPIKFDNGLIPPGDQTIQSRLLRDTQLEQDYYGVLSWQHTADRYNMQLSPYISYGRINYNPDRLRDLSFQGIAQQEMNDYITGGAQFDNSYRLTSDHTLRFGLIGQYTSERLRTQSLAFATSDEGEQLSRLPMSIYDASGNWAVQAAAYLQDEYRVTRKLTFNYGLRWDQFASNFVNDHQISPRANFVWKVTPKLSAHIGYARYFAPPSPQYIGLATLQKFANTTSAPESLIESPLKVEHSHYIDAGILYKVTPHYQITLDAFNKWAKNLGDIGQFGRAVINTPFSYRTGQVYGAEMSNSWRKGGWSLFGNVSYVHTRARDINSAEYQFEAAELAYIKQHAIALDHQASIAASAGASYETRHDMAYLDFVYSSGLRSGFANQGTQPQYAVFNIGYQHSFLNTPTHHPIKMRLDIANLFDRRYQIRDGEGVGVFQAQYGRRRAAYMTLITSF